LVVFVLTGFQTLGRAALGKHGGAVQDWGPTSMLQPFPVSRECVVESIDSRNAMCHFLRSAQNVDRSGRIASWWYLWLHELE